MEKSEQVSVDLVQMEIKSGNTLMGWGWGEADEYVTVHCVYRKAMG